MKDGDVKRLQRAKVLTKRIEKHIVQINRTLDYTVLVKEVAPWDTKSDSLYQITKGLNGVLRWYKNTLKECSSQLKNYIEEEESHE